VWPSTLRARLTVWYAALLGVPMIVLAVACYVVFERALHARTDRFIGDALTAVSRELVAERRATESADQAVRTTVDEMHFRDLHIVITDSSARIVAATPVPHDATLEDPQPSLAVGDRIVEAIHENGVAKPLAATITSDGLTYRVIARPLTFDGRPFALAGAYSMRDMESVLERIRRMFAIAIPLLILCAAAGGYVLSKRSLAPVSSMTVRAAEISATNLHERLPVGGGEELASLARMVNALLDRLEQSFEQQRRFMADASHELRTPAAILRAESDVTLSRDHRSESEYRASAVIMQDASRRLSRIVDDLFLLARADSGNLALREEALYLEELVHDVARSVRPVADRRSVRVELSDVVEAPFQGDADLLGRLLLNLLDNAIKHSPEGGTVQIGMARNDGHYEIAVVDEGPGVPPQAQARIFERFFRVDAARASPDKTATSGAGLGLAIARRIAEMHGGRLELVESRPGRTELRLTLPSRTKSR
jgi:heavy metal sensor kinase